MLGHAVILLLSAQIHLCGCFVGEAQFVNWIDAADPRDREVIDRWRSTVGPPVVPETLPEIALAPTDSLAIICWNTHQGGGDLVQLVKRLREGRFTGGRPVNDFVLLLQEVFRAGADVPATCPNDRVPGRIFVTPPSGRRIDIVTAARQLGLSVFYVPSMRNGPTRGKVPAEDRGNAILSTLPLSDLTAIVLPYEAQRRVAVAATIRGRSTSGSLWRLRVCSAHFDTRSRVSRLHRSFGAARFRQAHALVRSLHGNPAVLGGDFNTWAFPFTERAIRVLRESFPLPSQLDGSATYSLPMLPDRRIDYIFCRLPKGHRAGYHRLDELFGSDHFPLLGWVQVAD